MNAISIGPFIFAPDRFAAILAIAAFLLLSEILARKVDRRFSSWAWGATLAFIVGARAGHVIKHGENFFAEPLRALYLWQGGFMIKAGVVLVLAYTLVCFRRELRLALWAALPAVISAYVAVFILQLTAGTPATPLPSGQTFRTLAGESFQPAALKGEPLVINLWASWCPPCRREMPMIADVAASTDDARLVFINQGEGVDIIRGFLEAENLELDHVVLDTLGEFRRHYKAPGLPATLFIARDGTLQSVHMGEISREGLTTGIRRIAEDETARD
ncbi:prolipoprotein diacylglyceryl transferase family protein [Aquamicrobium segne]|uniref:Prolipoprotein diacylglyceryl transferase family protein n=1 Tax=Aquamicrobium segne TaxID=469547 RepID=A0ABW0H025_9HYPH